jgi:hypothetical protein
MAVRALIIAIEEYATAEDISPNIRGAIDAAKKFMEWLDVREPGVTPKKYICTQPRLPDGIGATMADITDACSRLIADGENKTEDLYVFICGHGFGYFDRRPSDILVTADYTKATNSGATTLVIGELFEHLQSALGPGSHCYFVDTCRNNLTNVTPGSHFRIGMPKYTEPSAYTIHSVRKGAASANNGVFGIKLNDGLRGSARAKEWPSGKSVAEMHVTFNSLIDYFKDSNLQHSIYLGRGNHLLTRLKPAPKMKCRINVEGATADESFALEFRPLAGPPALKQGFKFSNARTAVEIYPGSYEVDLTSVRDGSSRIQTLHIFTDVAIVFADDSKPLFLAESRETDALDLDVASAKSFVAPASTFVTNSSRGPVDTMAEFGAAALSGTEGAILIPSWAKLLKSMRQGNPGLFILTNLPRKEFRRVRIFHRSGRKNSIEIETKSAPNSWREGAAVCQAGAVSLLFIRADGSRVELESVCFPGRNILITIENDTSERLVIGQFVLKGTAIQSVGLQTRWNDACERISPVKLVKLISSITSKFRTREPLRLKTSRKLAHLLFYKWRDPLIAAMAAYELVRRGQGMSRQARIAASNLLRYFPELPDAKILVDATHNKRKRPVIPIFADGLRLAAPSIRQKLRSRLLERESVWLVSRTPSRVAERKVQKRRPTK